MRTVVLFFVLIATATLLTCCKSSPTDSGSADPEVNFDALWKGYDANYSFFEIKRLNWDSLYSVYRPQVNAQTTFPQLFQITSSLLSNLKDGHVNLLTPFGNYSYSGWWTPYPTNFVGLWAVVNYLKFDYGYTAAGLIRYGKTSDGIGYMYIASLSKGAMSDWISSIDVIIDSLKNTRGIVMDLRNNGGGNDTWAKIVSSRFADSTRTFSWVKWRNGPKHSDFTDYQPLIVGPDGPIRYTNRVAVLTNRRCFSSAEEMILMMKSFPQVKVIGDTTGGGSGNPLISQLPNGWTYWVPRWIEYTADKQVYEGAGLAPDIPVWISKADSAAGHDTILERALQYLR